MNPPIRDKSHYDRLWYAVKNNINDTIGSDHAPHLKANKDKEYPNSCLLYTSPSPRDE